jgi:hypothetical protein
MTDHTPIQCVTIPGLMQSRAALRRLLIETEGRIRDELAKEYGVSIGDRVKCWKANLWVTRLAIIFQGDDCGLFVSGRTTKTSGTEHTYRWDPATCTVVKKGEPG